MVTACPKCRIHFRCATCDKCGEQAPSIEVKDITEVMAEALENNRP